jgi:hypothetical protein
MASLPDSVISNHAYCNTLDGTQSTKYRTQTDRVTPRQSGGLPKAMDPGGPLCIDVRGRTYPSQDVYLESVIA